jgi:hypothetical protein
MKMEARQVVLIGVDMGDLNGKWYANNIRFPAPKKQASYVGQWRKWIQSGFKRGLWPIPVYSVSPYFHENCPGTPIKKMSVEEALSC